MLRLEWRLFTSTKAPWLIAAAFVLTSVAAAIHGAADSASRRGAFEDAQRQQRAAVDAVARELAVKELPPQVVLAKLANFRAALEPLPAAVLSVGESGTLAQRYALRAGERFSPFGRTTGTHVLSGFFPERPTESPAALLMGDFDLAFVVVVVFPILILALTCNVVNADRESGVLALIEAQPVPFRRWMIDRLSVRAGFVMAFAVLLPLVAASVAAGGSWARLAIWTAALTAYCAFWFVLAVWISLRTRAAATGYAAAICVWFLFVILIPAVTNLAIPLLAPPTLSYVTVERGASLDINPRIDAATAAFNRYRTIPHDLLPAPWANATMPAQVLQALTVARREMFEERLRPALIEIDARERRIERASTMLQFSSSALLLERLMADLAGTGRARWQDFLSQLDDYIRRREAFLSERILAGQNIGTADAAALAPFTYREELTGALLRRSAGTLAALFLVPGMTAALAWRAAHGRKVPVRLKSLGKTAPSSV